MSVYIARSIYRWGKMDNAVVSRGVSVIANDDRLVALANIGALIALAVIAIQALRFSYRFVRSWWRNGIQVAVINSKRRRRFLASIAQRSPSYCAAYIGTRLSFMIIFMMTFCVGAVGKEVSLGLWPEIPYFQNTFVVFPFLCVWEMVKIIQFSHEVLIARLQK